MMRRVLVRDLGVTSYPSIFEKMRMFSRERNSESQDEVWLTEHLPVFTMGQSAKKEHLIAPGTTQVCYCDRGGQVTYHGPGQLTVYLLLDIRRMSLDIRELVTRIESCMIGCLSKFSIEAHRLQDAPGVYVESKKIGALGLRVTRGRCYHGMSLNVDMNLKPFSQINPCGLVDMSVTQVVDYHQVNMESVKLTIMNEVSDIFDFTLSRLDNPEL